MGRQEALKKTTTIKKKIPAKKKVVVPRTKKKIDYIISHKEKVKKLMVAISNGYSYSVCCKFAGISEQAFYTWKAKGLVEFEKDLKNFDKDVKDKEEVNLDYLDFYIQLLKNESIAEIELMNNVKEQGKKDWRASAWILERRFKKGGDYETVQKVEVKSMKSIEDSTEEELLKELEELQKRNG